MTRSRSYKTARRALLGALAATLAACASTPPDRSGGREGDAASDDWGVALLPREGASGEQASITWTIVLVTFSAPGHPGAAARTVGQLPAIDPRLGAARVHTTSSGSMVVYGSYGGPGEPEAQADLEWIKSITVNDAAAFPRAMLTRIRPRAALAHSDPFDLMSVRRRFPHVDPLYTLEVAVWGDFESGQLTLDQIHAHAERYARELRAQGFDAYYYHDDDKRLSTVTVGLFDRTAIDPRSGFYSAPVERLLRLFPAHLVNGEPLREPLDSRRPSRGTRVQRPMLVHVPKL